MRYFLLHHFGGVYLDMSVYPVRNLEPLLGGWSFACAEEDSTNHYINMAFLASQPGHPILGGMIAELPSTRGLHVLSATGPKFFTNQVHAFRRNNPHDESYVVYNREYVYPYGWWPDEKHSKAAVAFREDNAQALALFPQAYLVKDWEASWMETKS